MSESLHSARNSKQVDKAVKPASRVNAAAQTTDSSGSLSQAGNLAVQRALFGSDSALPRTIPTENGHGARLFEGGAAQDALNLLKTSGAAVGSNILLAQGLDRQRRDTVLNHELRHVQQVGLRDTDFSAPLRLGARGDRWEREANALSPPTVGNANPQVIRRYDPDEVTSQLPGICEPASWDDSQNQSIDPSLTPDPDEVTGEDEPGYSIDPTLIDVTVMSNRELIQQGIDTQAQIASFQQSSEDNAAWFQLQREVEEERARRVERGYVFMATARTEVPADLVELRPGELSGSTGIYVADPVVALDVTDVSIADVIMTHAQLRAYLQSSGMMEVSGPEAERAIQILQGGDVSDFAREFSAANDPTFGPQLSLQRMRRTSRANDLVTFGNQPQWMLPVDENGIRAVGLMGEASYWTGREMGFGQGGIALNDPSRTWINVLGQTQRGNSPIADFMLGGGQPIPGPLQGMPVSAAATSQDDQARATQYLMYKMAAMLDVPGRSGAGSVPQTPTIDMATAHIRQMAQNQGLAVGSSEFAVAQQRFLADTMFSVPRDRLAEIRSAVGQPFEVRAGGRRPAMLGGYRALYDQVLRDAPISATRLDGQQVQISNFDQLVAVLPNSLRGEAERVAGGPGQAALSPSERAQVFEMLGRMAQSRVVASEDTNTLIASSDLLRGVGQPGVGEMPTRVLPMNIEDFAATGQRIRQGIADPRSTTGDPGSLRWRTAQSASQADAYLSFMRMLSGNMNLSRSDPEFATLRAAVTREIILTMPADQQAPLLQAIMTSNSDLAQDIRTAITSDNAGIVDNAALEGILRSQTTTFDLTTPELQGTQRYVTDLHSRYGSDAERHFSADALTLYQQPGLHGVARRLPGSIGSNLWANALGYGVTMGLDSVTGREVQVPTLGQVSLDLAMGVGSEALEQQMAARLFSRVPIGSALGRSVFQRAGPGFIIQPAISVGMGEWAMSQDRDLYSQMGIEMTDEEVWSRRGHNLAVGLTGAAAGAGTLYVIGAFTAGGSAAGPPGMLVGFLIGAAVVGVGALAGYIADKSIPGGREEYIEQHRRELEERARLERERIRQIREGILPMQTLEAGRVPIPMRHSLSMTAQEQRVIANWFMQNAAAREVE